MIAVFNNIEKAKAFEQKVHSYLLENRSGYNAEKWDDVTKHYQLEKFAVSIPDDYFDLTGLETIENIDDWHEPLKINDNES